LGTTTSALPFVPLVPFATSDEKGEKFDLTWGRSK
jgi:hypothetical protein